MRAILIRILCLAGAMAYSPAFADHPSSFGIFSNMHIVPGERDLIGMELFIVNSTEGCYVHFQSAEGEPRKPKSAKCIISGNTLTFTLPSDQNDYRGRFSGRFVDKGIKGKFDSGQVGFDLKEEIFLPRRSSFWQRNGK